MKEFGLAGGNLGIYDSLYDRESFDKKLNEMKESFDIKLYYASSKEISDADQIKLNLATLDLMLEQLDDLERQIDMLLVF